MRLSVVKVAEKRAAGGALMLLCLSFALAPSAAANGGAVDVVRDFGAKGDGVTDDWEAIQRAVGMEATGRCAEHPPALVVIPPTKINKYRISQAIRLCSNVTLKVEANSTEIDFTGDAQGKDYTGAVFTDRWPTYGAILAGNIGADLATPAMPIAAPLELGAMQVRLAHAQETAQLRVGDIVDVETTSTFSPAGVEPTRLKAALIAGLSGGGVVKLDRPMDFASDSVQLRRLTNLADTPGWPTMRNGDQDSRVPIFAVHHCGVIGGRWVAASKEPNFQPFNGGGGMLDCVVAPDEVIAGYGVGYGNFMQESTFSVRRELIQTTPFEMAYHSSRSTTMIGVMEVKNAICTRPTSGWDIALNEGSHDNRVYVKRIEDWNGDVVGEWRLVGKVSSIGGETLPLKVISPDLNGGAPIEFTYHVTPNESIDTIVSAFAKQLNGNSSFVDPGFFAVGRGTSVIITNTRPTIPFLIAGGDVKGMIAYSPYHSIVALLNAYNNEVDIKSVGGGAITGYVIDIFGSGGTDTAPATAGNNVSVIDSRLAFQYGYVRVAGRGTSKNVIYDGAYYGRTFQPKAFWFFWDAGEKNVMRNLVSNSSGQTAWSDRKDTTNIFDRVISKR